MNFHHKCQGIPTEEFDIFHLASTGRVPVCMQELCSHPNGGKNQIVFFQYRFMNLIFIYFIERGISLKEYGNICPQVGILTCLLNMCVSYYTSPTTIQDTMCLLVHLTHLVI